MDPYLLPQATRSGSAILQTGHGHASDEFTANGGLVPYWVFAEGDARIQRRFSGPYAVESGRTELRRRLSYPKCHCLHTPACARAVDLRSSAERPTIDEPRALVV